MSLKAKSISWDSPFKNMAKENAPFPLSLELDPGPYLTSANRAIMVTFLHFKLVLFPFDR